MRKKRSQSQMQNKSNGSNAMAQLNLVTKLGVFHSADVNADKRVRGECLHFHNFMSQNGWNIVGLKMLL